MAGRPVVVVNATHAGPPEAAERDLAPLRGLGPVLDTFAPRSYLELQAEGDHHNRWGRRNYWKGLLLAALAAEAVDTIGELLAAAPGPDCGVGRLTRRFGLTLDNLVGVELVTAAGERVRADPGSEPELFWGLRGAGANFGIATSFELRLAPGEGRRW